MHKIVRFFVMICLLSCLLFLVGCGSNDSSVETTFGALITSDEDITLVEVQRFVYAGSESPSVETIYNFTMPYGVMKFLDGRGSVEKSLSALPPRCYQSKTLGISDAMDCWANPLLYQLAAFSEKHGLIRQDIIVTLQLPTNIDETVPEYTLEQTSQLLETADTHIDAFGFDARLFEEPNEDEPINLPTGNPTGYNHTSTPDRNNPDWMSRLPKEKRLKELSLPGTHDTVARYGGDIAQTQGLSVYNQLRVGIRVLDVRLKCTDDLCGYHGIVYQHIYFYEIMDQIRDFLTRYPSETVYMRVKNEADSPKCTKSRDFNTFSQAFAYYFNKYSDLFWQPRGERNPTLEQTRGKVVVLQNFEDPDNGYKWGIPYSGEFWIQDDYHLTTNWDLHGKWDKVKNHLIDAKNRADDISRSAYVNYLSGSGGSFPYFVASGKSSPQNGAPRLLTGRIECRNTKKAYPDFPRVSCTWWPFCSKSDGKQLCSIAFEGTNSLTWHWLNNNNTKYTGIVMMDFPGGDLIDKIISVNFK